MNVEHLRYMIDQIAKNLAVRGHDAAVLATADHIDTFWEPRMKNAIFQDDHALLSPIGREAVELLASGNSFNRVGGA